MQNFATYLIYILDHLILLYFLFVNSFYILLIIISIPEILKRFHETTTENLENILQSESVPPITIIGPAFNEEDSIVASVRSMLNLSYRHVEVIIVNDGSVDQTLLKMVNHYQMEKIPPVYPSTIQTAKVVGYYRSKEYPNLLVIDKENGGKADALNAGINACETPFFMAIDADTIIERDALRRMIRPVLTDKNTIASGATIRVVNNCPIEYGRVKEVVYPKKILPAIQVVEYLRAFLFGRLGWNKLGGNLVISGAFGLFLKQAVIDVGGYRHDTVGEDMELVVRLHHHYLKHKIPYKISFIPDPIAWTEVPDTLHSLSLQRERWHRGLIDTLMRHREMLFNPKYGKVGMLSYPFFFFGEMLAPVVEIIGYIGLAIGLIYRIVDIPFAIYFFFTAWGLMLLITLFTVIMEVNTFRKYHRAIDLFKMFIFSILENIGYRQLTVFWRLAGFWNFLRGDIGWNKFKRRGF